MKKTIILFFSILLTNIVFGQSPQRFKYQAAVRDAFGNVIANNTVGFRISILEGSASGNSKYTETHTATTNINGLVSLEIGGGTIVSGRFDSINWGDTIFFIKVETDVNGGTNYTITGTSQLLSVPYALHAGTSSKTADPRIDSILSVLSPYKVKPSGDLSGVTDFNNISDALLVNDVVTFAPGKYYINNTINITSSNKILHGIGDPIATTIKFVGGTETMVKTFSMTGVSNICIENLGFESNTGASAYGGSFIADNSAIVLSKNSKSTVKNCRFTGFLSAAVNVNDYASGSDYRENNIRITECRFDKCWMGVATYNYAEYGLISNNFFNYCRTAILNVSGNWMISDNDIVDCRAAIIQTSLAGEVNLTPGGNHAHGNIVGNTMNHCDDNIWTGSPMMQFGGLAVDPMGVWIYGYLAPSTFYSNVMWYSDMTVTNTSQRMHVNGIKIANSIITADNAIIDLSGYDIFVNVSTQTINGGVINQ